MKLSEEQIRRIAAMRDDFSEQILKHQEQVELLEGNVKILEAILKGSSFTKASALVTDKAEERQAEARQEAGGQPDTRDETSFQHDSKADARQEAEARQEAGGKPEPDAPIPVTDTNGQVMADAHVTPEAVTIVIRDGIKISQDTPPFRSFFLDRIIGEMKRKDITDADAGKIQKESVIDCMVEGSDLRIGKIIVKNYRQKERVKEIINTISWSLARMIENKK